MKIGEIIAKWANYVVDKYNELVVGTYSYEELFIGLVTPHLAEDSELVYSLATRLKYLKEDRLITDDDYEELINITAEIVRTKTFTFENYERIELYLCLFQQLIPMDRIQILKTGGTISFETSTETAKWLISIYDKVLLWN